MELALTIDPAKLEVPTFLDNEELEDRSVSYYEGEDLRQWLASFLLQEKMPPDLHAITVRFDYGKITGMALSLHKYDERH